MKNIFLLNLLILAVILYSNNAKADLNPTSLNSFISESELIITAKVEKSYDGYVTLKVNKIHIGDYKEGNIKISWSKEVHDQEIKNIDSNYLLFLRKNDEGGYTGTHYGRSYWPILYLNDNAYIDYSYPITMVDFSNQYEESDFGFSDRSYLIDKSINNHDWSNKGRIKLDAFLNEIDLIKSEAKKIKDEYNRKLKEANAAIGKNKVSTYPDCADYMFYYEIKGEYSFAKICKGYSDKDFLIKNGWLAHFDKDSGAFSSFSHYKDGKEHGSAKSISRDGSRTEVNYANGEWHGKRTYWHANGNKWQEGFFVNGKFDGKLTTWYKNGIVKSISIKDMGITISKKCWNQQGNKLNKEAC